MLTFCPVALCQCNCTCASIQRDKEFEEEQVGVLFIPKGAVFGGKGVGSFWASSLEL